MSWRTPVTVGAGVGKSDSDQGRGSARLCGSDRGGPAGPARKRCRLSARWRQAGREAAGPGVRIASGDACDRQRTHRAQSCVGWSGACAQAAVPSSSA